MLGMAISLLFALAALAAIAVIRRSLVQGSARARLILAELAEIENRAAVSPRAAEFRFRQALQHRLAAA